MDYLQILTRSLAISWRHKYLWLLALLAGEATTVTVDFTSGSGGGNSFNSNNNESAQAAWTNFTSWITTHVALLWASGIAVALLFAILFVVSAVATGALIKASAEHDADRPFGLRQAWSSGVRTFGPVLRLKLFALVVFGSLVIVVGGLAVMTVTFGMTGAIVAAIGTGALALMLLIVAIPSAILFGVTLILGTRAIVLDGKGASEGLRSALRLMWRRKGRVALLWLLVWIAGGAVSIVVGLAVVVAAVPVVALSAAAYFAGGWPFAIVTALSFGAAWLIVVATVVGGMNAFTSTCWTVAYKRFDLQTQPAVSTQPQPA